MKNEQLLTTQVEEALLELLNVAGLNPEETVVIGCSTSEVIGRQIGSATSTDAANTIIQGILPITKENGLFLAVQCCEHLNRAVVVERECAKKYGFEIVSVVPHEKAGGAFATIAMKWLVDPVVVETIVAHAGLDIGDTFIGMHLKRVAVPVRLSVKKIGEAHVTAARTRPKLIGGKRAKYI